MELVLDMPFDSPFKGDFACAPTCNNYFSDTHVAALRVDEPSTVALAFLGLGSFLVLRRRQQLLPVSQGR